MTLLMSEQLENLANQAEREGDLQTASWLRAMLAGPPFLIYEVYEDTHYDDPDVSVAFFTSEESAQRYIAGRNNEFLRIATWECDPPDTETPDGR